MKDEHNFGWHHFPHGADIGICGVGGSLADAYEQAALAMTAVQTDKPVCAEQAVEISCKAPDASYLLVEWLNALIYEMDLREMIFGQFEIATNGLKLRAIAWGETVDRERHQPTVDIKGATYTALSVEQDETGTWRAQCVLDV